MHSDSGVFVIFFVILALWQKENSCGVYTFVLS